MSHVNTFHLHRNQGGSEWDGGGQIQKSIKKCHEINKISTLTSPNKFTKCYELRYFFTVIFNNLTLVVTGRKGT